jgi:putative transcriptional regulator
MPVVRMSAADAKAAAREIDAAKLDSTTDEEIARQITEDPDVAPDLSEMTASRDFVVLCPLDVAAIRAKTGLSRRAFALRFDLPLKDLRQWEELRFVPPLVRTYLRVIEHEPEAVARALAATDRDEAGEAESAAAR